MAKKTVYIEVWQNEDCGGWSATAQGDVQVQFSTSDYPLAYFRKDRWDYWFKLEGKYADAIVCSREAIKRSDAICIASRIISGKGLRVWRVDLQ